MLQRKTVESSQLALPLLNEELQKLQSHTISRLSLWEDSGFPAEFIISACVQEYFEGLKRLILSGHVTEEQVKKIKKNLSVFFQEVAVMAAAFMDCPLESQAQEVLRNVFLTFQLKSAVLQETTLDLPSLFGQLNEKFFELSFVLNHLYKMRPRERV